MNDAKGNVTSYEYDTNGNRTKVIYPDGSYVQTRYDECGRTVWQKDTAGRKTEYTYDGSDRLVSVKQNNDSVTSYEYDKNGNLTGVTDANNNTTTYVYDEAGRRVKTILADGAESGNEYDTDGTLISSTDYKGICTTYEYDDKDRLINQTTGADKIEYTYDEYGRLTDLTEGESHITYGYNSYGELASKTYENGQKISYDYDSLGRTDKITVSQNDTVLSLTGYEYDKMDRLTRVVAHDGTATVYTYDANGNKEMATFANGEVVTFTYDDLNRLILQKEVDRNGTVIAQYSYTLGKGGEREKVTESGACGNVETTYDYDKAGRLVKEVTTKSDQLNSEKKIYIYVYDAVGNRIEKVEDDTKTNYAYNSRNQLVSEETPTGKITYSYDANGNLLNKTGAGVSVTYSYDVYNRLVEYTDNSNTETYSYDAEGVRRSKKNATGELLFISDTTGSLSMLLAETDDDGNLIASYTRADTLISQTRGDKTSTYLYDGHGDVRALLNEAGRITDKYRYTAYGDLIEQSGDTENHFRYTGEYYDGVSDLYYLRARYMSTDTGTFISMDTYEGSIYDPDSLHKYLYANGNPVKYSDPSGKSSNAIEAFVGTTINSIINNFQVLNALGIVSGITNAGITEFLGGSDADITLAFFKGYGMAFGVGAISYILAEYEVVSLAQMCMFLAGSNSVMTIVLCIVAVNTDHPKEALVYYTLSIVSLVTFCNLYNMNCAIDIVGDKGSMEVYFDNEDPYHPTLNGKKVSPGTPYNLGAEGESYVSTELDMPHNNTKIEVNGRKRIPDFYDRESKIVVEVKNVDKLSYTRQLRDFVDIAIDNDTSLILYTRKSTVISGPLQEAIDLGLIEHRFLPW